MNTFIVERGYGSFHIFRKIRNHEHFFARSRMTGEVPSVESAEDLMPRWRSWSSNNIRQEELANNYFNNPAEYASMQHFILRCARWNALAKSHRSGRATLRKRYRDVIIGVRLPDDRPSYMHYYRTLCVDYIGHFCTTNTHRMMSLVVQPGADDDEKDSFARLHEDIQQYLDKRVARWPRPSKSRLHRMEQPTEEEWARDWEEGDVI
jgi:hypothetical protein